MQILDYVYLVLNLEDYFSPFLFFTSPDSGKSFSFLPLPVPLGLGLSYVDPQ